MLQIKIPTSAKTANKSMANYWIKLYNEILHDPKMGKMSDHLWRRCIEIFLMAGENNQDGILPDIEKIAWDLRSEIDEIENDLNELAKLKIVTKQDNGYWFVTKFSERQAPMEKREYMRRKRNEIHQEQYYQSDTDNNNSSYQPVTNSNTDKIRIDTDKNRIREEEEEEEKEKELSTSSPLKERKNGKKFVIYPREMHDMFCAITGFAGMIGGSREFDLERIESLWKTHGDKTVNYCRPFWEAWKDRGYSKTNTAWLDWAISGEIPSLSKKKLDQDPTGQGRNKIITDSLRKYGVLNDDNEQSISD